MTGRMDDIADETLVALECPRCMHCGNAATVTMTMAQFRALAPGQARPGNLKVQHILPDWSPDQRELLISGTHPECWTAMFGEPEDDEPEPEDRGAYLRPEEYEDDDELECEGHESLAGEHMGETVYCDGSCRAHER